MKHKFILSGECISLDQNEADVMRDMQAAIDQFFPAPNDFVKVGCYKELDDKSFEMEIERTYKSSDGMALGHDFVCDQDESLLTGICIDSFQPFKPGAALVGPLIPWYDNMIYTPDNEFARLWKQINNGMAQEEIKKITILPMSSRIGVKVVYKG